MKNFKSLFYIGALFGLILWPLACSNSNSPTTPNQPAPTPTFTSTYTPCLNASLTPCTATNTPTATNTFTPTNTFTKTYTPTNTFTATNTPTKTSTPTFTNTYTPCGLPGNTCTPTATATAYTSLPMGIFVAASVGGFQTSSLLNASCQVSVNQRPEPSDVVVLTMPSGPMTLGYQGNGAGTAMFSTGGYLGYQPNFNYQMTVYTSLGTASASNMAPGGNMMVATDGSNSSWQYEGNRDALVVTGPTTVTYDSQYVPLTDINSPFSIPNSAYPQTGGVTYAISTNPINLTNFNLVSGSGPATGGFTVSETYQQYVVK